MPTRPTTKTAAKKSVAKKKTTTRKQPAKAAAKKTAAPPQPKASVPGKVAPAPDDLEAPGRKLWHAIADTYELRPDEYRILEDAAREADLIDALATEQRAQPMMITGSMGQQILHPLITEVRQHRATLSQLLSKLKLPDDPTGADTGAAPVANDRANQAREAANARWSRRGA